MRVTYLTPFRSMPREVAPGLYMELPGDAFWEDVELDGGRYNVTLTLDLTPEGIRPVSVRVDAREGSPPISGTVLRAVKVWDLAQHVLLRQVRRGRHTIAEHGELQYSLGQPAVELSDEDVAKIRAQGPTDESLEWVARFYNMGIILGLPPAKQVELNLDLPRTTASKWIRKARERGFLDGSPSAEGADGGEHPEAP